MSPSYRRRSGPTRRCTTRRRRPTTTPSSGTTTPSTTSPTASRTTTSPGSPRSSPTATRSGWRSRSVGEQDTTPTREPGRLIEPPRFCSPEQAAQVVEVVLGALFQRYDRGEVLDRDPAVVAVPGQRGQVGPQIGLALAQRRPFLDPPGRPVRPGTGAVPGHVLYVDVGQVRAEQFERVPGVLEALDDQV